MPSMLFLPKVTTPLARSMTEYSEQPFCSWISGLWVMFVSTDVSFRLRLRSRQRLTSSYLNITLAECLRPFKMSWVTAALVLDIFCSRLYTLYKR